MKLSLDLFFIKFSDVYFQPEADWPSGRSGEFQNGRPSSGRRPGWFIIKEKVSD